MLIFVTVKPRKKENIIEKTDNSHYIVFTKEIPVKGRVNNAVQKLLSKHLNLPRNVIILKSGATSKHKVFEIRNFTI